MIKAFEKSTFYLMFVLLIVGVAPSFSQEGTKVKQDSLEQAIDQELKQKQPNVRILLDKIEILGRIEKPQTVFILPGQSPVVDDIQVDRSFFKEIFRQMDVDLIRREIARNTRRKANK